MSCQYDGLGRLAYRNLNGTATIFYYAGGQRLEEHDCNNAGAIVYLYFYEAPGSDAVLFRSGGSVGQLWYQRDLMGNTTHVSNASAQVVEEYLYDAWGKPTVYDSTGAPLSSNVTGCDNRYLWKSAAAYEWLNSPALYRCRARYYLPQQGCFLQPDPIRQAGGLNIYQYCYNDPINAADPSGCNGFTEFFVRLWAGIFGGSSTSSGSSNLNSSANDPNRIVVIDHPIDRYFRVSIQYPVYLELGGTVPDVQPTAEPPSTSLDKTVMGFMGLAMMSNAMQSGQLSDISSPLEAELEEEEEILTAQLNNNATKPNNDKYFHYTNVAAEGLTKQNSL